MDTISKTGTAYLLETGIDQLHHQSRDWLNEIIFMRDESRFLEKLLDQNALRATNIVERKEVEQLQNRLIYYRGEVMDELRQLVRQHEHRLAAQLQNSSEHFDESYYRYQHTEIEDKFNSFRKVYSEWKQELIHFIESLG